MSGELVGSYYLFTTPFAAAGVILHVFSFFRHYKNGDNDLQYVFLAWLVSAVIMCLLNENITVIHTNMIHIPIAFYGAYGIMRTAQFLKNRWLVPVCVIFWSISFCLFLQNYVETQSDTSYFIDERADEALERAKELAGENGTVTVFNTTIIKCSYLLWYEKPDPNDYYKNVVYTGPAGWAEMYTYGRYRYLGKLEEVTPEGIYIIYHNWVEYFMDLGFEVEQVNDLYYIAVGMP